MNDENKFAGGLAEYPFGFCDAVLITRHPDRVGEANTLVRGATGTLLRINDRLRPSHPSPVRATPT